MNPGSSSIRSSITRLRLLLVGPPGDRRAGSVQPLGQLVADALELAEARAAGL